MNDTFFSLLKEKLSVRTTTEFDARFWSHFEEAVGKVHKRKGIWYWLPAGAVAMGILFVIAYTQLEHREAKQIVEKTLAHAVLAEAEMYGDMEMLGAFEELPVDDQDWQILLGEG